jgi:trk system potassium uptake protein TrkH
MAAAMVPSLAIAGLGGDPVDVAPVTVPAFAKGMGVSALVGLTLLVGTVRRRRDRFGASDGFAVATFGWLLLAILAAVPLYLCKEALPPQLAEAEGVVGTSPNWRFTYIDAFFETMSGLTTTGSSVFGTATAVEGGRGVIEALPPSFLFLRSLCHWLGGMGIIVLCLAVLPALRAGGYQAFQAEVPGPVAERLRPRIRETATILWGVYVLLTVAETVLLWLGRMPLFDAICHAFGTMATGGYSTKDASIGHYAQAGHPSALYFEVVITVFMVLAGINFLLHFQALRGSFDGIRRNRELLFYAAVLAAATIVIGAALALWGGPTYDGAGTLARHTSFQVVSITTTTGYCTADFNAWPTLCRAGLVMLMFFGGCAGSTGGGMKQIRILVLGKYFHREMIRLLRPGLQKPIRVGDTVLDSRRVANIVGLVILWVGSAIVASLILAALLQGHYNPNVGNAPDSQLLTSITAVIATINNIGPGLSGVGASQNFGWMPGTAKLLLCLCMLMGRLEIYSVVIMLLPRTWRL